MIIILNLWYAQVVIGKNKNWSLSMVFFSFLSYTIFKGNAMFDSRCYLEGGGSTENFNASEDLTIGSVVGKQNNIFHFLILLLIKWKKQIQGYLSILGDPRAAEGNITLDLRERDAAVVIKPGTKELILTDQLDREGKNGLNSIYVNVICKRRYSSDTVHLLQIDLYFSLKWNHSFLYSFIICHLLPLFFS